MGRVTEETEELEFEGSNFFRLRLTFATLSGRPVRITKIREDEAKPGLKDFENKLLSLLERITNGTKIFINKKGTQVDYTPGVVTGGAVSMNCGVERCLSYFLEPLIMISPFCKVPMKIKLHGVTNAPNELSVDRVRVAWMNVYNRFNIEDEELEMTIQARGLKPAGGGTVIFNAPIVKQLRPVINMKPGKVCKIRGLAFVTKVSPSIAFRMIESAKKGMRDYISDVYITTDQRKGDSGGKSPGYGILLWAETTDGVFYTAEAISRPKGEAGDPILPEEVGTMAAHRLLEEIYRGGCCDSSAQSIVATFMTLNTRDVSRFLVGPLSVYTVNALRHLRKFFHIVFKIDEYSRTDEGRKLLDQEMRIGFPDKVILTGLGLGYSNLNKFIM